MSNAPNVPGGMYGVLEPSVRRALMDLERRATRADAEITIVQNDVTNVINVTENHTTEITNITNEIIEIDNTITAITIVEGDVYYVDGSTLYDESVHAAALAVDAIKSHNYTYVSGDFSEEGSFFDLANGDLTTPGLNVDGESGDVKVRGDITATSFTALLPGTDTPVLDIGSDGSLSHLKLLSGNDDDQADTFIQWRPDGFPSSGRGIVLSSGRAPTVSSANLAHGFITTAGNNCAVTFSARTILSPHDTTNLQLVSGSASTSRVRLTANRNNRTADIHGEVTNSASKIDLTADTINLIAPTVTADSIHLGASPPTLQYYVRIGQVSSATGGIVLEANSTASRTAAAFRNTNGNVGSIITSGTATAFNTSSDERLKRRVGDYVDGLETLKQIKIHDFEWISSGERAVGPFAQELAEVWPSAVTEGGDDPSENPWAIDNSKLVPLLIAAVQELAQKVEALSE